MTAIVAWAALGLSVVALGIAARAYRQAGSKLEEVEDKYTRIVETPEHSQSTRTAPGMGTSRVSLARVVRRRR